MQVFGYMVCALVDCYTDRAINIELIIAITSNLIAAMVLGVMALITVDSAKDGFISFNISPFD
jgi:hypothetical protein